VKRPSQRTEEVAVIATQALQSQSLLTPKGIYTLLFNMTESKNNIYKDRQT
jgi:hypothetical protein